MQSYSDLEPAVAYLGYFKDIRERRSWMARLTVVVAVVGLLGLNIYLMFLSTNAVIANIDQARIDQTALADNLQLRIDDLEQEVESLRGALGAADAEAETVSQVTPETSN